MNAFWHRMWGPRTRTLPNGKTVSKKRSLTWLYLILVVLAFYYSIELTGFKMSTLLKRGNQFFVILGRMYPPNWDYWASVQGPLLDTIKMSILLFIIIQFTYFILKKISYFSKIEDISYSSSYLSIII